MPLPIAAITPVLHTYPMQECLRVEKLPWVFLEKRESLFIIVSRVLLAEELVGESETCQARGLGTRQAQEVRGGGATTDPMAMSEQRASPKHRPLSPKTQNQKPQAKTYKSVTERHQMHLVSTREKRGDGPMCRALLCRQRIKTNDDPKKKKNLLERGRLLPGQCRIKVHQTVRWPEICPSAFSNSACA